MQRRYNCLPRQCIELDSHALRTVQDADMERIRIWRNAQVGLLRQRTPLSSEQQQHYYEAHIWPSMCEEQPQQILLSFLHQGRPIGYGGLVHIAWEHRRAEASFLLDPARAASEAVYARDLSAFFAMLRDLAFADLGFQRLFTETYAHREYHMRLLEGCGFKREGRLRHHVILDGKPLDSILHGCLAANEK